MGLVTDERWERFQAKRRAVEAELARLDAVMVRPTPGIQEALRALGTAELTKPVALAEVLRRPEIQHVHLRHLDAQTPVLPPDVVAQVEVMVKYAGYIERQQAQVAQYRRLEGRAIPEGFAYERLTALSHEGREKLRRVRPTSVGQAARIGPYSADIAVLLVALEQHRRAAEPVP